MIANALDVNHTLGFSFICDWCVAPLPFPVVKIFILQDKKMEVQTVAKWGSCVFVIEGIERIEAHPAPADSLDA